MNSVAPGEIFLGKYRIEQVLGQGGMGVVVSARHLELDELVAIKFMHPNFAGQQEQVERFLREGRAAAKIKSEHVARVRDVGKTADGVPYMILEHLTGSDLASVIKDEGKVAIPDAVEFLLQACEALAEAHTSGIVHRDLKPANLFLIVRADGSPCVKLLDFGISKLIDAQEAALTATNGMMGSPLYMAPEQLSAAKSVDKRADIWALGIILYELVTGERPFDAPTLPQLVLRVATDAPTPITNYLPDAPEALVAVIDRCLTKNPDQRYENVGVLASALAPLAPPEAQHSIDRIARVIAASTTGGQKRQRTVRTSPNPGNADATGPVPMSREESAATMVGTPPIDAKLAQTTNGGSTQTKPAPVEPAPSRRGLAIAIGGMAVALLALAVVIGTRREPPATPAAAASAAPVVPPPATTTAPAASPKPVASPDPVPTVPSATASVTASTKPMIKPVAGTKPSTSSAAPASKNCDPPYVIDADGNKKYKLECL